MLPADVRPKVEKIALDFSQGLRGLDRSALLPLIIGTAGIWLLYGVSMFVSLQGFPDPAMGALHLRDAFLLLALSGIAFTIPTPGGIGSYQLFIQTGLASIFGVPATVASAYAIVTLALSYISVTLLGLGILVKEGISFGTARTLKEVGPHPSSFIPHPSSDG